ncbi:MAG: adenylyltransferase/cytidyltransferase family protein [Planctomycetes bacterium]|nr:adenylyltransferase/cytidyltransferase family protein [Planctomycetota bacterium]
MTKVFVSGIFDMLHSGHVAFIQEAAKLGDVYVGVGSDHTVRTLKGRNPVNSQEERLFMIQALKGVTDAFVCQGDGMLNFVEEVRQLRPDILFVNADGANPEKEKFCAALGITYMIGNRTPHAGLPARSTTRYRDDCRIPYRLDLAGAWMDQQQFSSLHPGPVVTVSIEPNQEYIDRAGMATSTRNKAIELWGTHIPAGDRHKLAKSLFCYENPPGRKVISGSQDSLGILLPGINRLHYAGDYWPEQIESCLSQQVLDWLEQRIYLLFVQQRKPDYDPYRGAAITKDGTARLAAASEACWRAILAMDMDGLCAACLDSFAAQVALLPAMKTPEVEEVIASRQPRVRAWKTTGAGGGGYMVMITERPDPDMMRINICREVY